MIKKLLLIIGLSLFINSTYISTVYSHDHTPRKKLIFKLKTEILELGGDPIKKGNIFKADQKYIEELQEQLNQIIEDIKKKEGIEKVKKEIIEEIKKFNVKPVNEKESFIDLDKEVIALRKQLEELKLKQEIEETKAALIKELEELGVKVESKSAVDSDDEITKLKKLLEDTKSEKAKAEEKRIAEEKQKEEARVKEVKNELLKELEKLGVKPKLDTSDVDDNAEIKALKKQIEEIKAERKKAADKKKAEEKKIAEQKEAEEKKIAEQKEADRQKAIEDVKKEILFFSETPIPEYEFKTEDKYIAALREQLEEIRKIKEEEELKQNAAIPEWYLNMPEDTLDVMYVRGAHTSADIDQSEVVAIERARIKLARNLQSDINTKFETVAKEAGVDGDLTLKQEFETVSKVVAKNVSLGGYKIYKTKMAAVADNKFRTYIVLEVSISSTYKNYIKSIETNEVIKKNLPKLKDTEAFKELEQYVAEYAA